MSAPRLEHTRTWVSDLVRSGLLSSAEVDREVRAVVATDHPGLPAEATADEWIARAREAWAADAQSWPAITDHDRLQAVFATLAGIGVAVLQGVDDHWSAKGELDRRTRDGRTPRGIAWFTQPDVWHAIDEGMLEVNLWHGDTANAAPEDRLLDEVLAAFAAEGLPAHFDEGRIEVSAFWQRRP